MRRIHKTTEGVVNGAGLIRFCPIYVQNKTANPVKVGGFV